MLSFIASGEKPKIISNITTNNIIKKTEAIKASGIQRGEVTHHQDQSIFPVSLRTKNITNNKPDRPIPDDEFFEFVDITIIYLIYLKCCFFFEFL